MVISGWWHWRELSPRAMRCTPKFKKLLQGGKYLLCGSSQKDFRFRVKTISSLPFRVKLRCHLLQKALPDLPGLIPSFLLPSTPFSSITAYQLPLSSAIVLGFGLLFPLDHELLAHAFLPVFPPDHELFQGLEQRRQSVNAEPWPD